jgi:hypothetical protein
MFSNQALRKLIIPIFLDQLLIITVGIIATMMVSKSMNTFLALVVIC